MPAKRINAANPSVGSYTRPGWPEALAMGEAPQYSRLDMVFLRVHSIRILFAINGFGKRATFWHKPCPSISAVISLESADGPGFRMKKVSKVI